MSRELLSNWFGVAAADWPPDHYRLLGLPQGEADLALIEQRVHQRLDEVRRYQVAYPEPATEAMNRLAQAFVCLTDSQKKKAYDESLHLPVAEPPPTIEMPVSPPVSTEPVVERKAEPLREEPFSFLYDANAMGPGGIPLPPVRVVAEVPAVVEPQAEEVESLGPPPLPPVPPPPPRVPVEEVMRTANSSPKVCKGLATRRALYRRIALTRQVLQSWTELGKYLENPERPLNRAQAVEMYRLIEQIEDELSEFPLMGELGQQGYLILSLTRVNKSKNLVNLDPTQRDSLSRDWKGGLTFLLAHLHYLREKVREVRRLSWWQRTTCSARAILNEQPLAAVLVLGMLVALGVAIWRQAL
jgi:hypothetical protein